MKIITAGNLKTPILRGKCVTCGAIIEATEKECKLGFGYAGTVTRTVKCPTKKCLNEIFLCQAPWDFQKATPREREDQLKKDVSNLKTRVARLEGRKTLDPA